MLNRYIILMFDNVYRVKESSNIITRSKLEKHSLRWEKPIQISPKEFDEMIDSPFSEIYRKIDDV